MKQPKKKDPDMLAEYDFTKMKVVAYGPGWKRPPRFRKKTSTTPRNQQTSKRTQRHAA